MALFNKNKLDDGLQKTRTGFWSGLVQKMRGSTITDDLYDELEEALILADVGADVAFDLVDDLRRAVAKQKLRTGEEALAALRTLVEERMTADEPLDLSGHPAVILVIGVNGVGKTTSIAKLAKLYKSEGKSVLLAAGDTFRAAATEQLDIWAGRAGVPIVKAAEGADPAAVIFDAVQSAAAKGTDLVICDTAGRLHNKKNLMDELGKISRSVGKACADASVETLLVLDAITGQNAISQAAQFIDAASASGIILTKLDGTAKGGCVISIKEKLGLPVRFIGVGEGMDDLMVFDPEAFAQSLLRDAKADTEGREEDSLHGDEEAEDWDENEEAEAETFEEEFVEPEEAEEAEPEAPEEEPAEPEEAEEAEPETPEEEPAEPEEAQEAEPEDAEEISPEEEPAEEGEDASAEEEPAEDEDALTEGDEETEDEEQPKKKGWKFWKW